MVAPASTAGTRHPERRPRGARRRGLRPARLLRVGPRHPGHRPAGRGRSAVHQLPHHGPVLTDPGQPADRAQPPQQRHGSRRRVGHRVPRVRRHHRPGQRVPVGGAGGARLGHLRARQVAPHPRERQPSGRVAPELAARPGLRAVLRVPPGGDPSVRAGPGVGQPPGGPSGHTRGGLPPDRGPGGPRHPVDRGPAGDRRRQAVLPLLLPRGLPLAPPGSRAVDRTLPGTLRRGLGRMAASHVRPPACAGDHPRRVRTLPPARLGAGLGHPLPRRAAPVRPLHGGLRRVPVAHRPRAGAPRRVPGGVRRPGRHRAGGAFRQRGQLRGWSHRVAQRPPALEHGPALGRRGRGPDRRDRWTPLPQQLSVGLDRGRQQPRSGGGSARCTRAGWPTR